MSINPDDLIIHYCIFCKCCFKLKSNSAILVKRSMFHHKNHHKKTIFRNCALTCEKVGFKKNSKVHELVTELKYSVNTLHEKFQHHLYQPKDVETSGKRKLLTPHPLTVALVHSTKLNQIAFVLRDVLWVVCLNRIEICA